MLAVYAKLRSTSELAYASAHQWHTFWLCHAGITTTLLLHTSNHAAHYLQNLLKTVEKLPFLQEVIDDLAADPAVGWNCQTGGVLGNDHIHAIELEIAPIYDDGEYVEIFTFEDSVSEPDRVHAFSLYSRIADSADFSGTQALRDAETLAECELMTLLALRKINHLKAGRALAD